MTTSDQEQRVPKDASGGCYIGIDLFKYEGGRRTYSVVLLCEGKVVSKYDDVGLEKVIRLCWEWEVSKLAIDNIAELAESKLELGRVVSLLPEKTSIYQINLSHGREKDFREMLRTMGIPTAQLTPSKTAYYLALLASMGVGEEVVKKEARTKIIVRKNRNLSSGGMSSNRYKRKVRTAILQIVNSIK
jgi:predicted RNase H-like nuclease (RuvC/YqgF family)